MPNLELDDNDRNLSNSFLSQEDLSNQYEEDVVIIDTYKRENNVNKFFETKFRYDGLCMYIDDVKISIEDFEELLHHAHNYTVAWVVILENDYYMSPDQRFIDYMCNKAVVNLKTCVLFENYYVNVLYKDGFWYWSDGDEYFMFNSHNSTWSIPVRREFLYNRLLGDVRIIDELHFYECDSDNFIYNLSTYDTLYINRDKWIKCEGKYYCITNKSDPFNRSEIMQFYKDLWIEKVCNMVPQSEKEYYKSKYKRKKRGEEIMREKADEAIRQIISEGMNSGTKRKIEQIKKKYRTCNFKPEAEFSLKPEDVVMYMEKLLGLWFIAYRNEPLSKCLGAFLMIFKGSVSIETFKAVSNVFNGFSGEKCTFSDFVNWLKEAVLDVDKFKRNRFAEPFFKFVTNLFSIFICPSLAGKLEHMMNCSWYKKMMKLFDPMKNPMECILHYFTYVCSGVETFIQTGSLKGFIETETIEDQIISLMREIRPSFIAFKNGDNEYLTGCKMYEMLLKMEKCKKLLIDSKKSKIGIEAKQVEDYIKEIISMELEVRRSKLHSTLKKQGYYVALSSGSGISKSHLSRILLGAICQANNIPCGDEYVYYLNQANKFQSGWKNFFTCVIVDDAAAMLETVKSALVLADWLLRGSNNIPHELLGAGVEEKGALFNRSLVELWLSNSFYMDFSKYANNVSALMRRFRCQIVAKVRPEYTKTVAKGVSSQIDYDKMTDEERNSIAPDAWLFTIHKCEIEDTPITVNENLGNIPPERDNRFCHPVIIHNGKEMRDINLEELLEYLTEDSRKHFKQQDEVLRMSKKTLDFSNYCEHGIPKCLRCRKCTPVLVETTTIEKLKFDLKNRKKCTYKEVIKELVSFIKKQKEDCGIFEKYMAWGQYYDYNKHELYRAEKVFKWRNNMYAIGSENLFDILTSKVVKKKYKFLRVVDAKVNCESIFGIDSGIVYKTRINKKLTAFLNKIERKPPKNRDINLNKILIDRFNYTGMSNKVDELYSITTVSAPKNVKQESAREVKYCKWLTNQILNNTKPTDWKSFSEMILNTKNMLLSFRELLKSWFDDFFVEVITILVDKMCKYIREVIEDPFSKIPCFLEGTIVGSIAHIRRKDYKIPLVLDYIENVKRRFGMWLDNPYQCVNSDCTYEHVKHKHEQIRTRTRFERKQTNIFFPDFREFSLGAGHIITKAEKAIKSSDPDMCRDILNPLAVSAVMVQYILPIFTRNIRNMYVVPEMDKTYSISEIQELDREEREEWYKARKEIFIDKPTVSSLMTSDELYNRIVKNICRVRGENGYSLNGLLVKNGMMLLPKHFISKCINTNITILKGEKKSIAGNKECTTMLHKDMIRDLKGDMSLVYISKMVGHMKCKDLTGMFLETEVQYSQTGCLYYRDREGIVIKEMATEISFEPEGNNEDVNQFWKAKKPFRSYFYRANTQDGMCGAPLIDLNRKHASILGLHVGGNKEGIGLSYCINSGELNAAINSFDNYIEVGPMKLKSFGEEKKISEFYSRSPFVTESDYYEADLIGSIDERYSPTSKVINTPIYNDVIETFGVNYKWGPAPVCYNGDKKHGVKSLVRSISTRKPLVNFDAWDLARKDYKETVLKPIKNNKRYWKEELRILTDEEVVNGVVGKKFLNGLNMSTKCHEDLPGKKSIYASQRDNGTWVLQDFIWKEFHEIEDKMKQGIMTPLMFTQMLKDEATPQRKIDCGKVRSFFMAGIVSQMLVRKYFLTTFRYWVLNADHTECSVGINPHSLEWNNMIQSMKTYNKSQFIALDLKNFDLTQQYETVEEAFQILKMPMQEVGNMDNSIKNVMNCLIHSVLHSVVNVNGDLVVFKGIIPSGSSTTSILGSTVNSIIMRQAYYSMGCTRSFRKDIKLRVFSDDSLATSKNKKCNVSTFLQEFKKLNIYATDMHKNVESSVKYYTLDEVEFLKRGFRYDKDFGTIVAPLLEESMFKSICSHTPPKTLTIEALTGQCVDNFLLELAFHGRKKYEDYSCKIKQVISKHNLKPYTKTLDMTFDERVQEWKQKYCKSKVTSYVESQPIAWHDLLLGNIRKWQYTAQELKEIEYPLGRDEKPRVYKRLDPKEMGHHMKEQSEKLQVLAFSDDNIEDQHVKFGSQPASREEPADNSLGEFMSRPLKVAEYQWGNTYFVQELDPWVEFLNNPRVANRVSNYNMMRATCRVKMIINGNGFFYGGLQVSYLPFGGVDSTTYRTALPGNTLGLVNLSQCKSAVIDPTTSKTVEFTLPFLYDKDYMNLAVAESYSPGILYFREIAPLKHANTDISTTLSTVSISIYAWFEDLELQVPTKLNYHNIVPQAEDCSNSKPISQPATIIADAASKVADVPVIGKYARAVEMGGRMTATVASALGYSRPNDPTEPEGFKPQTIGNLGITNTTDSSVKLSLDVKQDLCLDGGVHGATSEDELSFANIAKIDTLMDTFQWSISDNPGDMLWNIQVCPWNFRTDGTFNLMSSTCGISRCFSYWRGSMVYKFKVLSSSYHRGRLAIVYDPVRTATTREDNVAYTEIIDIATNREFEITVGNNQSYSWLQIPGNIRFEGPTQSSTIITGTSNFRNGTLSIYVLNSLTVPNYDPTLNTDVTLVQYARGGPDLEYAAPASIGKLNFIPEGENVDIVSNEGYEVKHGMESSKSSDLIYMGENIDSFRTLAKRYYPYFADLTNMLSSERLLTYHHQFNPCEVNDLARVPYGGVTTSEVLNTLFVYLCKAFSCWKGNVRWKILLSERTSVKSILTVSRKHVTTPYDKLVATITPGTAASLFAEDFHDIARGGMANLSQVNPSLEFEMPYYHPRKFVVGKKLLISEIPDFYEAWELNIQHAVEDSNWKYIQTYVALSENFTYFYFTGWPPVYA